MKFGQNEKVLKMYDWAAASSDGEKEDPEKRTLIVTDRRVIVRRQGKAGVRVDEIPTEEVCGISAGFQAVQTEPEKGVNKGAVIAGGILAAAGIGVAFLHTLTGVVFLVIGIIVLLAGVFTGREEAVREVKFYVLFRTRRKECGGLKLSAGGAFSEDSVRLEVNEDAAKAIVDEVGALLADVRSGTPERIDKE